MQPKPSLTLRRPPPPAPADPNAIESFIAKGAGPESTQAPEHLDAQEPSRPAEAPKGPGLVRRASGKVRRRMTVYLPPDLARALLVRAAEEGADVSDIVTAAVTKHLEGAR
jgi:hypothetical protein